MTERFLCVLTVCVTFFTTTYCVMSDWKSVREADLNLRATEDLQKLNEFLMLHPSLMKPSGPQVIIPRERDRPKGDYL